MLEQGSPDMSVAAGSVVLDLDGVVYLGSQGIEGAGAALKALEAEGWQLLYATNNASVTPDSVCEKIARLTGFEPERASVVTCAMAAARYLSSSEGAVYVVGEQGLTKTLVDAGITTSDEAASASAVVVGIDSAFTYDKLDNASRAIRRGAAFIATNTDANYPTPTGLAPGAGSIVAAVERAGGKAPIVVGKPEQPMIDILTDLIRSQTVWVVGDRPETDIAMAHTAGWGSILPLTGVVAHPDELVGRPRPDHVVSSIAEVPGLLRTLHG